MAGIRSWISATNSLAQVVMTANVLIPAQKLQHDNGGAYPQDQIAIWTTLPLWLQSWLRFFELTIGFRPSG
jgi:hypothetical protein